MGCKDKDGGRGSVHCELVMGLLGPCGTVGPGCAGAFCRSLLDTLCQGFVSFQLSGTKLSGYFGSVLQDGSKRPKQLLVQFFFLC